jgi:AraC-like DNA-binding protein
MMRNLNATIHHVESKLFDLSSKHGATVGRGDPLASAVELLRPRIVIDAGLHAAGEWSVEFDPFPHAKLGIVARGECRLAVGDNAPVLLREGDFYLLTNPRSYKLYTAPGAKAFRATPLWGSATEGVVRIGSTAEEDFDMCCGTFFFDEVNASIVTDVLPELVHVSASDPRSPFLTQVSQMLAAEFRNDGLGGALVQVYLAQILFVYLLRNQSAVQAGAAGWLGALDDPAIGAALRSMHADVAHRWTLTELAARSQMSRSAFAASFKRQVGASPIEYLIRWRMSMACDALRYGSRSISELTAATGYESESAFSAAFRHRIGVSPRDYRASVRQ